MNERYTGPDFLYIGASKAGSTWIYNALKEHPELCIPDAKDIQFFDYYYDKGFSWYESFFKICGFKKKGELSHDYFLYETCAKRIYEYNSKIKLIVTLREPIDKTISAFIYNKSTELSTGQNFIEYAFSPKIIKLSSYYENLKPFYELFPAENILITFYDDLKNDNKKFIQDIFMFLNVGYDYVPSVVGKKILSAREPKNYFIAHLAYKIASFLRKIGFANLVGRVKSNYLFNKLLYNEIEEKESIDENDLNKLYSFYSKQYSNLEKLIGKKIPKSWKKIKFLV